MKLNVRAFGLTTGLFLGGTVAVVGAANMAAPDYGRAVLELFVALYPGYSASGTLGDWSWGILVGMIDGTLGGALFAWLYNWLVRH